ncbi:hypothetical protein QJQ45_004939 [Haematococcus lacustris]|nr:hypothetical protein QJQ45_004939 [Haematococcus lacustris]
MESSRPLVPHANIRNDVPGFTGIAEGKMLSRQSSGAAEPASKTSEGEYLFLSHNFVHSKLKFSPPCEVELVLEPCAITGAAQSAVYRGRMQESACKGYYSLNAAPKALLVGKDIYGLRIKPDGRMVLQVRDRAPPLQVDEGRRRVNPRVVGITTSIRVDFLRACFGRDIEEPRHSISVRVEVNGVRQPEVFTGASISHNRQGSYYVLGLPFALVHGREFCAWRQLDEGTLELSVQDIDPAMAAIAAKQVESSGTSKAARGNQGIVVDSRISIPLAMLKRDLAEHLDRLLPMGMGPSFDIPSRVQYRVDGKLLPRVYDNAVIKKSEHRGCCYLNGTERIPVKSKVSVMVAAAWEAASREQKMLTGLELDVQTDVIYLDFRSNLDEIPMRSPPTQPPSGCASATPFNPVPLPMTGMLGGAMLPVPFGPLPGLDGELSGDPGHLFSGMGPGLHSLQPDSSLLMCSAQHGPGGLGLSLGAQGGLTGSLMQLGPLPQLNPGLGGMMDFGGDMAGLGGLMGLELAPLATSGKQGKVGQDRAGWEGRQGLGGDR